VIIHQNRLHVLNKAILSLLFSLQIQMEVVSALTLAHNVKPYMIWPQKTIS
jgi:hypothetical protein